MKKSFLEIETKADLANFLEISTKQLDFNCYNTDNRYTSFKIGKKSGGSREILAPIPSLKSIQKKISKEVENIYKPKKHIHSYVSERSIKTGAFKHVNKNIVLNVDLQSFFPSINFGRVRGVFMNYPFNFKEEVSNILAQISCQNNTLPQGSPLSPVISNLICRSLDNDLIKLSRDFRLHYTRYADDLTFSTNLKKISKSIIFKDKKGSVKIGSKLQEVILKNGFQINLKKVSIRYKYEQQFVTGLVVNERLNVKRKLLRETRAMLHALNKYGLKDAARDHFEKYSRKHRGKKDTALFLRILEGKLLFIADIRGKDDALYKSLISKYQSFSSDTRFQNYLSYQGDKILVYTEGNTDWMHLEAALDQLSKGDPRIKSLRNSIKIVNYDANYSVGDTKLKSILEGYLISPQAKPIIGIFDSDQIQKLGEFVPTKKERRYNNFNNKLYCFYLPRPFHRRTDKNCIEHYYQDVDLKKYDSYKRRIYLSNEFNSQDGKLISDQSIHCSLTNKKLSGTEDVIDNNVWNSENENIALSKKDFAINIYKKSDEFQDINFNSFKLIFNTIHDIVVDYQSQKHFD